MKGLRESEQGRPVQRSRVDREGKSQEERKLEYKELLPICCINDRNSISPV